MKSILIPLTVIAIAITSASCNRKEGTTAESESESSAKPYPLDACLVSGEKLGSMGVPVTVNHEGQEIKFCCDSCIPEFKRDPAKFLSILEQQDHNH